MKAIEQLKQHIADKKYEVEYCRTLAAQYDERYRSAEQDLDCMYQILTKLQEEVNDD